MDGSGKYMLPSMPLIDTGSNLFLGNGRKYELIWQLSSFTPNIILTFLHLEIRQIRKCVDTKVNIKTSI
jgi:hypothetical protein